VNRFRSWYARRRAAIAVVGLLVLASSCGSDETLRLSPQGATVDVAQGGSGTSSLSMELRKRRNVQSVSLPADVDVVGADSDIPSGIHVSASPATVTIPDRDVSVTSTITVDVDPETPVGSYQATIRPRSTAEHLESEALSLRIRVVQGEAPVVHLDSPQSAFVGGNTLTISATVTDAQNDFQSWEIFLDDASLKSGGAGDTVTTDADITSFGDGTTHTVRVDALDGAGHTGTASATFVIDRGAPQVTITQPGNGAVIAGGGPLDITGTVSDPEDHLDHWELKLDDGLLTESTTPGDVAFELDTSTLAGGQHTISLGAVDRAVNVTVVEVTITIDQGAVSTATPQTTPTP